MLMDPPTRLNVDLLAAPLMIAKAAIICGFLLATRAFLNSHDSEDAAADWSETKSAQFGYFKSFHCTHMPRK